MEDKSTSDKNYNLQGLFVQTNPTLHTMRLKAEENSVYLWVQILGYTLLNSIGRPVAQEQQDEKLLLVSQCDAADLMEDNRISFMYEASVSASAAAADSFPDWFHSDMSGSYH